MSDWSPSGASTPRLLAEIARLNKVVTALMDRAERSTNSQGSDFGMFQTAIMLESEVRRRTADLEAAVSENERINRALRESEARFRGLVSQSLVGIATIENGRFTYANPKFADMFGYSGEAVLCLGPLDLAIPADRPLVAEQLQRRLGGERDRIDYVFHGLGADGGEMDIECHSSVFNLRGKRVVMSLVLDITERTSVAHEVQALQTKLREQAIRDPLTGLYNRQPINELFDRELHLAERHGYAMSIIMGDLDDFKTVNDTYGHLAGDEVLRVFGALLKQTHRASDIFCRYGGDEFLILLPGTANDAACERTEQVRAALEGTPIMFGRSTIATTASFGVATFPQQGGTRDELISAADRALYAAKEAGRNQVRSSTRDLVKNVEPEPISELVAAVDLTLPLEPPPTPWTIGTRSAERAKTEEETVFR